MFTVKMGCIHPTSKSTFHGPIIDKMEPVRGLSADLKNVPSNPLLSVEETSALGGLVACLNLVHTRNAHAQASPHPAPTSLGSSVRLPTLQIPNSPMPENSSAVIFFPF